jgi:hypothetical protein
MLRFIGRRRRAAVLTVVAEPDTALLASAAALRRLGARITRYDSEAGMLEARTDGDAIRLTVSAGSVDVSRLSVESETADSRSLARRLRAELSGPGRAVTP